MHRVPRPTLRAGVAVAPLLAIAACIPVRVPTRPAVSGVVYGADTTRSGSPRPLTGLPLALSETRRDSACRRVAARTVTGADGRFAFPRRKAWRIAPLLGIADAISTWHVCVPAADGRALAPAYTGSHFGGLAAPPADSARCLADVTAAPGGAGGMRCTSLTRPAPGAPR